MCYTSNNTITIQPAFGSAYFKHSLLIGNVNYEHTDTTWKSCDAVDVQCTMYMYWNWVKGYGLPYKPGFYIPSYTEEMLCIYMNRLYN